MLQARSASPVPRLMVVLCSPACALLGFPALANFASMPGQRLIVTRFTSSHLDQHDVIMAYIALHDNLQTHILQQTKAQK